MSDMFYGKRSVLVEQKNDKIRNKWRFVKNETQIMGLVL
jgi:hypothetical protein